MNRSTEQHLATQSNPAASAHDLADLARSGYEILQQPFTHVDFEVHHTMDRPGYLRDNVFTCPLPPAGEPHGTHARSVVIETLASAANGVGLVMGTNGGAGTAAMYMTGHGGASATLSIDEPARRVFRGTALPNPTFLFESASTFEGIVSVESAPRSVRFYQSIAVRDLIQEISRIASDVAVAPLVFLQAPVQLPSQGFVRQDVRSSEVTTARRSSSLAVRFSIALQQPSARLRFQLTDVLRRYCNDRGFGLWLADTRIGYRSGNWFQICRHSEDLSRQERKDRASSIDSYAVEVCLPATFIGPARIGSTHKIVSLLCQFSDIGIISASITTLDDLAFIHLQLTAPGMKQSDLPGLNQAIRGYSTWANNPTDALIQIHRALNPQSRERPDYIRASDLTKRAGDYQTLVGPLLPCVQPDRRKRIAVWFSWQMEGIGQDLARPLAELFACLSKIGFSSDLPGQPSGDPAIPNLEYLICRDIGNSVLRGRGKLSIPEADILTVFGGNGLESAAVRLCVTLEDAWKASLRQNDVHGVKEMTVAWREWWLGHWASPI